jgi:hypothetical protein
MRLRLSGPYTTAPINDLDQEQELGGFILRLAMATAPDSSVPVLAPRRCSGVAVFLGQESRELRFRSYCDAVEVVTCRSTGEHLDHTKACPMTEQETRDMITCPWCGGQTRGIEAHGHVQCGRCSRPLYDCCDGEKAEPESSITAGTFAHVRQT